MSTAIPAATRRKVYAQETDEAFLMLITVRHADLIDPIRLTSDAVATIRSDGTWQPFPFRISLPDQNDEGDAGARFEIDIVDRRIVTMLRAIKTAPAIDLEVIAASDPETPIVRYPGLIWEASDHDELTLSGTLRIDDFADEPLAGAFTPSRFTALFRS